MNLIDDPKVKKLLRIFRYIRNNILVCSLYFKPKSEAQTFVFHHIPRCAGTSIRKIFGKDFQFYRDYRLGWSNRYPLKVPLNRLSKKDCMSGHFETNEKHLFDRYPDIFENKRYFLFSFLRDPLSLKISNFYYKEKNDTVFEKEFIDILMEEPNFIAKVLNVNDINYKQIIDRYDFIGVFEEFEDSLKLLQSFINVDSFENVVVNNVKKDSRIDNISKEVIEKFKELNKLDYKIYNYCYDKFQNLKKEISIS